jgi:hypothetical protein
MLPTMRVRSCVRCRRLLLTVWSAACAAGVRLLLIPFLIAWLIRRFLCCLAIISQQHESKSRCCRLPPRAAHSTATALLGALCTSAFCRSSKAWSSRIDSTACAQRKTQGPSTACLLVWEQLPLLCLLARIANRFCRGAGMQDVTWFGSTAAGMNNE